MYIEESIFFLDGVWGISCDFIFIIQGNLYIQIKIHELSF